MERGNEIFIFWWHKFHCILLTFKDKMMGGGMDEKKEMEVFKVSVKNFP